jgi:hypothetical protein
MGTITVRSLSDGGGDSWWQDAPLAGEATAPAAQALDPRARDLAIRTVLGEAANEPDEGMAAVAAVIRNRAASGRFGKSVPEVILKPKQFEPWNTPEGRTRMFGYTPDSEPYARAARAVDSVFGEGVDPTSGATHFYSPTAQAALGREAPAWAQGEPQNIGRHAFFAPEGRAPGPVMPTADSWWKSAPLAGEATPVAQPDPPGSTVAQPDPPGVAIAGKSNIRAAQDLPEPTASEAFGRAAAKGLTANFYDELRGLMEAGGLNPNDPASLSALVTGAARLIKDKVAPERSLSGLITGEEARTEAQQRYDDAKAREGARTDLTATQRPILSVGGEIAGAITSPIARVGQGATAAAGIVGRMGQGIRQGAIYGGISGAGEGEGVAGTATGAASGSLLGGAVGAAAPVVMRGVEAAGRGVARAVSPVTNTIRSIRDPEGEAARRVTDAISRDMQAGGARRVSPQEFAAARAQGDPVNLMDIGGDTTRALGRSAANTSPEGRGVLSQALEGRFGTQGDRVIGWLNRSFHYPNAHAQQEALQQVSRSVTRPAYVRAYRAGDGGIWTPELERLAGSPAVVDAMRAATTKGRDRATAEGFGAFNPQVTVTQDAVRFNRGSNGQPVYPNLQFWDYTYRSLRDASREAYRAGRNDEGSALGTLARTMRDELDQAVPEFRQARAVYAHFADAGNALEAGENFVTARLGNREARQALARMSPQERQLFQDGFVSRYVETLAEVPDRRNVLNQIAQSAASRERLEIALGPQRARELEAMLRVEGVMQMANEAVRGNSTTARQLVELGLAGGVGGYGYLSSDPAAALNAALTYGAVRGQRGIDARVARRVADMLVSNDPRVLTRGLQIVTRQHRFLQNLRSADQAIARAGSGQASGAPALQAAGIGRAEDQ